MPSLPKFTAAKAKSPGATRFAVMSFSLTSLLKTIALIFRQAMLMPSLTAISRILLIAISNTGQRKNINKTLNPRTCAGGSSWSLPREMRSYLIGERSEVYPPWRAISFVTPAQAGAGIHKYLAPEFIRGFRAQAIAQRVLEKAPSGVQSLSVNFCR